MILRAFWVEIKNWPEATLIVAAENRGKATAYVWRAATDAGYNVAWGEMKTRRFPSYDAWAREKDIGDKRSRAPCSCGNPLLRWVHNPPPTPCGRV